MPKSQSRSSNQIQSAEKGAVARQRLLLLGGFLVAFALRLYHLGAESLWYDETVSVILARKSIPALIAHTAGDIHPPGYYMLLHMWQTITKPISFHGLEFLYAWPSLFFGLLIIALLFPVARRLYDRRVALLALWLAAVNPFHIWYSQEVRMYTVGAALGLLCFWILLRYWQPLNFASDKRPSDAVLLSSYALCAAVGLYMLYYFAFLLIALFTIALIFAWQGHRQETRQKRRLVDWLIAHGAIVLLWLPWLPTFWRQATDPPVPPWRVPWQSPLALFETLVESLRVLLLGESMNAGGGIWALWLLVLVVAAYGYTKPTGGQREKFALFILLLAVFAPLVMIVLTTLLVTPLYHVRYLFTYAPPLMIVVAAGLLRLYAIRRTLGAVALLILLMLNGVSLHRFWNAPAYRTDDHRTAVAELATNWRPGDAILVNAGWVYTALALYWPTELPDSYGALPPHLAAIRRMTAAENVPAEDAPDTGPILYRSGSVDGSASLGWGRPESDFFSISRDATTGALDTILGSHGRVWYYRLYDTVSDPDGTIRTWFDTHAKLAFDQPYIGRDFLRVQRYQQDRPQRDVGLLSETTAGFGNRLRLEGAAFAESANAGEMLYITLAWRGLPDLFEQPETFTISVRLVDGAGRLVAQSDESPSPQTDAWEKDVRYLQSMALPVAANSRPGTYSLEVVAYRQDTQEVLAPEGKSVLDGQRLRLGEVTLEPMATPLVGVPALATFDYIDLIDATLLSTEVAAGGTVALDLVWLPRPSGYQDSYNAVLALVDGDGSSVVAWREPLGGVEYPSGGWPAQRPVRDGKVLLLPQDLPVGEYVLTLGLERSSDGLPIKAVAWWGLRQKESVEVGRIGVR